MALQNILIPFVSIFRSAGLKQAQSALGGLNRQYDSLSKTIGAAVGAMAGFSALQSAQQFIVQSVESTQKFERNLLALNQVFEDAAPSLVNFTKEVQNYGLSQSQAAQASVFLGSVLKQYGFNVNEANSETQNLVILAQDLATTFGYDVQEALLAITALFRGEYDPIEKFGVAMKQNEINAVRAARGLGDLTGAAQMQADAQIRLELLFERASDSMGAFERATNTLYGSQQLLTASLQNLQIAAGAPLQEPLAAINNIFSAIIAENGEQIVDVFEQMGKTVEIAAPAVKELGTTLANFIGFLEPVVGLLNVLVAVISKVVEILGNALNPILEFINLAIDKFALGIEELSLKFRIWKKSIEDTPLGAVLDFLDAAVESGLGLGFVFDKINEAVRKTNDAYRVTLGIFPELEDGQKQASAAARKAGYAARETQRDLDNMTAANIAWGNSWTAKALHWAEENGVPLHELFKTRLMTGAEEPGTDYVGDFFRSIKDAVAKESAKVRLAAMGASEGLIEAILGANGWEQVYNKVIKGGIDGLKDLQAEFNKTAAGIDEMTAALEEAEKAQQALRDAAQATIDANIARLEAELEKAKQFYDEVKKKADEFRRWSLDNVTKIQILPDFERQLGRFESAITSTISGMRSELISALKSELIYEDAFQSLNAYVNFESQALIDLARRRDELASRYSLSEALIKEYQAALTGSLSLTSLFNRLKSETQKRTVTEVSEGVVKLGNELRAFGITVSRSYEETIEGVTDKTSGLLQGFRDMAQRARDFAANLQKLRDMGLDPMLFNQLVSAGAEAGGETAQAIIDGGQDSVNELNDIFNEINQLGAELGMDVGQTMYEAGQDITYGLLDGIKSEQEMLYQLAVDMARTFSETFKANFDVAIEAPVAAAAAAVDNAQAALDEAKKANVDALMQIDALIAGAEKFLEGKVPERFLAGAEEKLGGYQALREDIVAGQVKDISGITAGMTSARAEELLKGTGGTTVNNYYVDVKADTRTQGAKAGEALVDTLQSYSFSNGNGRLVTLTSPSGA